MRLRERHRAEVVLVDAVRAECAEIAPERWMRCPSRAPVVLPARKTARPPPSRAARRSSADRRGAASSPRERIPVLDRRAGTVVEIAGPEEDRVGGVCLCQREPEAPLVVGLACLQETVGLRETVACRQHAARTRRPPPVRSRPAPSSARPSGDPLKRPPYKRVAVQRVAGGRACPVLQSVKRNGVVGRNERLLDHDAVRAAALEPDQVAPVVERRNFSFGTRSEEIVSSCRCRWARAACGASRTELPSRSATCR